MAHDGLDMPHQTIAQHLLRGGRSGIAVGEHPVGCLGMPHQTVADNLQVMLLAVVDELVGHPEVEDAFCGCQHFAFHAVFCHGTVEMAVDDGIRLRHLTIALPLIDGSADEEVLAQRILQTLRLGRKDGHQRQGRDDDGSGHFHVTNYSSAAARSSIFLLMSSITSSVNSYLEIIHMANMSNRAGMTQTSQRIPSSANGVWSMVSLL